MSKPVVSYNLYGYYKNLKTLTPISVVNLIRRLHNIEDDVYTTTNCSKDKGKSSTRFTKILARKKTVSMPILNSCVLSRKINKVHCSTYRQYATESNEEVSKNSKLGKYLLYGVGAVAAFSLYKLLKKDEANETQSSEEGSLKTKVARSPITIDEIPDQIQYVIVGGGTTAFSASRTIKSTDPRAEILLLSDEVEYPYMRPPLSKELFKSPKNLSETGLEFMQWNGSLRSVYFENSEFYTPCDKLKGSEYGGIAIARGWKVKAIDADNKEVILEDGKHIKYDKCLIATGSKPMKLPLLESKPANIREKVTYFNSLSDFQLVDELLGKNIKTLAIYGGGLLGSELASSILKKVEDSNLKTYVVQIIEGTFILEDLLPDYLSKWLTAQFEKEGVIVLNNGQIKDIHMENNKLHIILSNNKKVIADHLLACSGAEPNTDIAKASGLEVDQATGGFLVNAELLARTDLYAAGDCASYYDIITGVRQVVTQYDHAIASGQTAAENMVRAGKAFNHHAGFWSEFCSKIGFEAVGNISPKLRTKAYFAPYVPENEQIAEMSKEETDKVIGLTKGIIFYLNDENIVEGIVLWNLFNRLSIARQVIAAREPFDDLIEIVKHFDLFAEDDL